MGRLTLAKLDERLAKAAIESDPWKESRLIKQLSDRIHPLPERRGSGMRDRFTLIERVMFNVVLGASDCWYWRGRISPEGYGTFGAEHAHRVVYRLQFGSFDQGLHVLHRCDVRACVNPEHLFLGTHADNMKDRDAKGRGRYQSNRRSFYV